jgi:hypothetical protein
MIAILFFFVECHIICFKNVKLKKDDLQNRNYNCYSYFENRFSIFTKKKFDASQNTFTFIGIALALCSCRSDFE